MNEEHHFLDQEHYASEKSDQPFSSHSEKRKSRFFENVPSLTRVTTEVVSWARQVCNTVAGKHAVKYIISLPLFKLRPIGYLDTTKVPNRVLTAICYHLLAMIIKGIRQEMDIF